jgi:hypothetical protein
MIGTNTSPNKTLKLTGAAFLVPRGIQAFAGGPGSLAFC